MRRCSRILGRSRVNLSGQVSLWRRARAFSAEHSGNQTPELDSATIKKLQKLRDDFNLDLENRIGSSTPAELISVAEEVSSIISAENSDSSQYEGLKKLMGSIALSANEKIGAFSAKELHQLLLTFSDSKVLEGTLLNSLCGRLYVEAHNLSLSELADILEALQILNFKDENLFKAIWRIMCQDHPEELTSAEEFNDSLSRLVLTFGKLKWINWERYEEIERIIEELVRYDDGSLSILDCVRFSVGLSMSDFMFPASEQSSDPPNDDLDFSSLHEQTSVYLNLDLLATTACKKSLCNCSSAELSELISLLLTHPSHSIQEKTQGLIISAFEAIKSQELTFSAEQLIQIGDALEKSGTFNEDVLDKVNEFLNAAIADDDNDLSPEDKTKLMDIIHFLEQQKEELESQHK